MEVNVSNVISTQKRLSFECRLALFCYSGAFEHSSNDVSGCRPILGKRADILYRHTLLEGSRVAAETPGGGRTAGLAHLRDQVKKRLLYNSTSAGRVK